MTKNLKNIPISSKSYSSSVTREQFLFYEMRITAKLKADGFCDDDIVEKIVRDNLFQYPTEKSLKRMASCCLKRLSILDNDDLIKSIAAESSDTAKQICLYAMMKEYRIVWDFMITVIGEKYRDMDDSFGRIDINAFFIRLQEQDSDVALWSDSTIQKIKQILMKLLVENEYLDSPDASNLNRVIISPILEKAIREEHNEMALPAFSCL